MNLVGALKERAMAFEKIRSEDSGDKPLASPVEKLPDSSLKAMTESIRLARERIKKKTV